MAKLLAVVAAGEASVPGVLAAEALRSAARTRRRAIEVEVRTADGVLNPLDPAQAGAGDALLLVGPASNDDDRFPGLPRASASLEQVLTDAGAVLDGVPAPAEVAAEAPAAAASRRIVAVTSCPTGIAHTFMAAEGLQASAKALGHAIRVETQGSVGARDTLTPEEIAAADLVLIAADRQVELGRFAGKRVFLSGTKPAINDGKALIGRAFAEAAVQGGAATGATAAAAPAEKKAGPYRHLMTGVSFMLPFVVAGGLLIALAFAVGGIDAADPARGGRLAAALFEIGARGAFALIVPALAGYIAFSIADRPGLAPGMVGGMLAAGLGAGFLGGIAAGFIAGYGTDWLNRHIRLPRNLEGLKPVLILPLLGTLLTGLLMVFVVGVPVAAILAGLTDWLRGMQGGSAVLLGLLLGGMMAVDMGGPVNKAAYAFSVGLLASQIYTPMAATMVGGMVPPLAVALATRLFPARFAAEEREAGAAAAVLGLAFITEGAIPFAARDPFRVIPCMVAGAALAGAICMVAGAEFRVPHGGLFVLPIPNAVTHILAVVLALLAGTVLSAVLLGLTKRHSPVAPSAA
ncbi:fructose-specific PTS transporter subunit EIIC [Roseomonas sp. NAR14]|uniref:protein-N(pi)-phosphohistidine--D-fructose phosphotransferase n=1 Tax=Roseomonas acroporae TaxID=2937791 RepID=A0A9X1Y6Y4_9PROT|nr:fructose-specific PTS transporter subunit EIIC [Roseomonas acroporae]MCK8783350.1 fructose-specific PTS transporter subunit EIIC [Roseomonas acroporae]